MEFKPHTEPMNIGPSEIQEILQDLFSIYNSISTNNLFDAGFEIGKLINALEVLEIGLERKAQLKIPKDDEDDDYGDEEDDDFDEEDYKQEMTRLEEHNEELVENIQKCRIEISTLKIKYNKIMSLFKSLSNTDRVHLAAQPEMFQVLRANGLSETELQSFLPGTPLHNAPFAGTQS